MMGSPEGEEGRFDDEGPQHRVTIGQRFAIGRYPVTFDEYDRFCEAKQGEKPADEGWGRGRRPVINVSWQDAQAYIAWLSQETGRTYRLPSEAEWEYVCRAGTATRYSFGDAITPYNANYGDSELECTSEVGAYSANAWGLHDMHGNVWEWVDDDWHENYRDAPSDGSAWKYTGKGPEPRLCVLRGGSWGKLSRGPGPPAAVGAAQAAGTTMSGSGWPEHFLNSRPLTSLLLGSGRSPGRCVGGKEVMTEATKQS